MDVVNGDVYGKHDDIVAVDRGRERTILRRDEIERRPVRVEAARDSRHHELSLSRFPLLSLFSRVFAERTRGWNGCTTPRTVRPNR